MDTTLIASLAFLDNAGSMLMVVLGVGFLIFFHELGHFLAAKWAGVRVEVFSLGFGQRLFGWTRGDTDYRVSLVPFGGYVRMYGEMPGEGDPSDTDSLSSKSVGQRFVIYSGGVVMNLAFALIAFPLVFKAGVPFHAPVVGDVRPGGPAWMAGVEPGDRIRTINGAAVYSFDKILMESALAGEDGILLGIARGNQEFELRTRPRFDKRRGLAEVGVAPSRDGPIVRLREGLSPAREAGLQDGDEIVAYLGRPYDRDLEDELGRDLMHDPLSFARADRLLPLAVERDGERLDFSLKPRIRPGRARLGIAPLVCRVIGLRDRDDKALARDLKALGLRLGDIITGVEVASTWSPVLDPKHLQEALAAATSARLTVLPVALDEHDIKGAPRKVIKVPKLFLGKAGAARLLDAVGLGGDTLTCRALVQPGLAAANAGLRTGDRILALAGQKMTSWDDIVRTVNTAAGETDGKTVQVRWQPRAPTLTATVEPREAQVRPEPVPVADYGFDAALAPRKEIYRVAGFVGSLGAGINCSIDTLRQLYVTLKSILAGRVSADNLGGIITISRVTYEYAEDGWQRWLYFLAILSLNLAFINVLPIPVLDGGQLMFLAVEKIKGSPVSARVMTYAQILGFVMVIGLLVFVTYNDILRVIR
ncbi:MAG: RIP metalloprotease RseP [Planctomycetes bacterium]|nr:RIP metalloprotease RseP [Planctomycetota bacterium]